MIQLLEPTLASLSNFGFFTLGTCSLLISKPQVGKFQLPYIVIGVLPQPLGTAKYLVMSTLMGVPKKLKL